MHIFVGCYFVVSMCNPVHVCKHEKNPDPPIGSDGTVGLSMGLYPIYLYIHIHIILLRFTINKTHYMQVNICKYTSPTDSMVVMNSMSSSVDVPAMRAHFQCGGVLLNRSFT